MTNSPELSTVHSTDEEMDLLQRSNKKIKNSIANIDEMHADQSNGQENSYKRALPQQAPEQTYINYELPSKFFEAAPTNADVFFPFSKEGKVRLYQPWMYSVIVKVYGRTVGYKFLSTKLLEVWKLNDPLNLIDMGNDIFLINFKNVENFRKALHEGPWFLGKYFLIVSVGLVSSYLKLGPKPLW